ncbi:MAG: hypothetical protein ACR2M1_12170 [Gemmatimonadaceae bacterium]
MGQDRASALTTRAEVILSFCSESTQEIDVPHLVVTASYDRLHVAPFPPDSSGGSDRERFGICSPLPLV